MANKKDTPGSAGRVIPVMLILLMLGIFLSLYFLKFVPQQQNEFNTRAFMELGQIENAVQGRNEGYSWAIKTFLNNIHDGNPTNPLLNSFTIDGTIPSAAGDKDSFYTGPTTLSRNRENGTWQISYPLIFKFSHRVPTLPITPSDTIPMSIKLDTVLQPVIATYHDIFEDYLLIRDSHLDSSFHSSDRFHQGVIAFNSGNLALDYLVNTDSLLKKNDGFSLLNIHDVSIEGSPYKLFLYPFQLGKDRIILAGLISQVKYSEGYKSISFNLIAAIGILVLLLFIHLPILKIYILGPFERITGMNIRMIIATYFVTAFIAFFIFSRIFLVQIQDSNNRATLEALSAQVQANFRGEISSMCRQLGKWDSCYALRIHDDPSLLSGMRRATVYRSTDSVRLDSLLYPQIYTFPDYVFWIDSTGKWIASWGAKNINNKPFDLSVTDRQFFKDFHNGEYLRLPDSLGAYSFTIQPALSKLDGEYTIVVAMRADSSQKYLRDTVFNPKPDSAVSILRPFLVGLSAQMYTTTNAVLPSGYNFSIVDDQGNIMYDAKPGRALLSNILEETDNPSAIREAANFHNQRYFSSLTLKGQQVSLLSTPMKGFPYTLITYRSLIASTDFQTHLLLIGAFFAAILLILLILSTMINEWSQKRPRLIHAPSGNFEWLHPVPGKELYYQYLIRGMLGLLGVYLAAWALVEILPQQFEFSLFYISLLFPFYTALYYFRLREKEKDRTIPVRSFLVLVILLIHVFALSSGGPVVGIFALLAIAQAGFITILFRFQRSFIKESSAKSAPVPDRHWLKLPYATANWLRYYAQAIVLGLLMIIMIPASGIFWLFFRQETNLRLSSGMLNTSLAIGQRRDPLNEKAEKYKFFAKGPAAARAALKQSLHDLKFRNGIYFLGEEALDTSSRGGLMTGQPDYSISLPYAQMHRWIFPGDSTELVWSDTPWEASDGSWYFYNARHDGKPGRQLKYSSQGDIVDSLPVNLLTGKKSSESAFTLMFSKTISTGSIYFILFFGGQALGLFLIYLLTLSLARRIFLLGLIGGQRCHPGNLNSLNQLLTIYVKERTGQSILDIGKKERKRTPYLRSTEQTIICHCWELAPFFSAIWATLLPLEKFVLYDFALDDFTNYKNGSTLYKLYDKYLIYCEGTKLVFMSLSFREWVLQQSDDKDISSLLKKADLKGPWQTFKLPLMILLATFGLFIFFTQDALYQKIAGLIASLSSLVHLFTPMFGKGNGKDDSDDS